MTRDEHLLIRAMEECDEVSQRISKALIFGMDEVQAGQDLTNRERIIREYNDLVALMEMAGLNDQRGALIDRKVARVEKYLDYSRLLGLLS